MASLQFSGRALGGERLAAPLGVSLSGSTTVLTFPADPTSVGRARRAVGEALDAVGGSRLLESAELVVSELVSNAVVHAGTEVTVRITAEPNAIRVEIEDGSAHLPVRRTWSKTAGTGRGLLIVDDCVDRWDATRTGTGKVVWFEIGEPRTPLASQASASGEGPATVEVTLLNVPLLMHWAWQEHAATLLREYLLYALEDDARALDEHAAASDALSVLNEQLPMPTLASEPAALMAGSVEPTVTGDEVVVRVPIASVPHFGVLDDLLARAVAAAKNGQLLGPPTQPEISEMRQWLCGQVIGQAHRAQPTPWRAQTDVRVRLDPDTARARARASRELARLPEPLIATNEASVIIAVSQEAVEFLGYRDESDLLGRRILVVIPARFHQAHIAGTTLHATNGRDVLLNQWITVPIVKADGSEVTVELRVEPRWPEGGHRAFVASFRLL